MSNWKLCEKKTIQIILNKTKNFVKRLYNISLNNKKIRKTLKFKIPSINNQLSVMKKDLI